MLDRLYRGQWIDGRYHTAQAANVGLILGLVAGLYETYRQVERMEKSSVADVDFPRTARRILTLALALTGAGAAYFFWAEALRGGLSFLFGAAVSLGLLALLARTLLLLDVTGTEGGNTPKATQALLMIGQFALFGAVYWVVNRFPIHVNAVACGFSVGIVAAMLDQGARLLRGQQD